MNVVDLAADMGVDPAELQAVLAASQQDASGGEAFMGEAAARVRCHPGAMAQEELALEESARLAAGLERRRLEEEERLLQEALALSVATPAPPEPGLVDDDDAIAKALKASIEAAEAEEVKRKERMRSEDDSELFQAALRASRVDLGPRGISQAAKIMATGDTSLGQAALVAKTGSHRGAGARFSRSTSALHPPGPAEAELKPASSTSQLKSAGTAAGALERLSSPSSLGAAAKASAKSPTGSATLPRPTSSGGIGSPEPPTMRESQRGPLREAGRSVAKSTQSVSSDSKNVRRSVSSSAVRGKRPL